MSDDIEPYGNTLFCDDIRTESSGQFSLIGVYPTGILIQTPFPAAIPKFGFSIAFMEPYELARKRDYPVSINICLPGDTDPVIRGEIPAPNIEALDAAAESVASRDGSEDIGPPSLRIVVNILMQHMTLRQPGLIRVRINYGSRTIKCGTLSVIAAPVPANANSDTSPANLGHRP
jgi:hypothetical protein